jgi:hypothetical protein
MLPAQASPPVDAGIAASPRQLLARAGSSTGTNNPPSPASSLQKRSHTEATRHAHGTGSAKGKERRLDQDANEDGDSEDDGTVDPDGKPRRKRSRSVRQFVLK